MHCNHIFELSCFWNFYRFFDFDDNIFIAFIFDFKFVFFSIDFVWKFFSYFRFRHSSKNFYFAYFHMIVILIKKILHIFVFDDIKNFHYRCFHLILFLFDKIFLSSFIYNAIVIQLIANYHYCTSNDFSFRIRKSIILIRLLKRKKCNPRISQIRNWRTFVIYL